MLILSVMGAVLVSLVTTGSDISIDQMQSSQALGVAEAGIEYVVENGTFPNYYAPAAVSLGQGSFTVSTPTWVFSNITGAEATIKVGSTAGFPTPGRIIIDSELIGYAGTTANSFTGATRGVSGTTVSSHPANNSVYPVTDLTADPGAAGTAIAVSSTVGFVIPGVVKAGPEYLYCTGSTPITFTGCQRAYNGSTASAHAVGTSLFQYTITSTGTAGSAVRVVRSAVDVVQGNVSFDFANNTQAKNKNPLSWKVNVGAAGQNRFLLVGVSIDNSSGHTVSGVTYNGIPLTFIGAQNNGTNVRVELWYLVAPATGNNDVIVTFLPASNLNVVAGGLSLTGVDQTSPLELPATFNTGNGATASLNLTTTSDNAMVFDTLAIGSNLSPAEGAGQTSRWNTSVGGQPLTGAGSTKLQASPGAVAMSWSIGSPQNWAIGAVAVRPAGGGAAKTVLDFREVY